MFQQFFDAFRYKGMVISDENSRLHASAPSFNKAVVECAINARIPRSWSLPSRSIVSGLGWEILPSLRSDSEGDCQNFDWTFCHNMTEKSRHSALATAQFFGPEQNQSMPPLGGRCPSGISVNTEIICIIQFQLRLPRRARDDPSAQRGQ